MDEHPPSLEKKSDIDTAKRHFLTSMTAVFAAIGAAFASVPFIASWLPSARAEAAGAPVQVDLTRLEPGEMMTIEWQGKPVWILRRTAAMIKQLEAENSQLRDPQSVTEQQPEYAKNPFRSANKNYAVLIGICTHLGCSPKYTPASDSLGGTDPGGFYCPCHGSTFDLAGRVYKGVPAPINLAVPPYHFVNDHTIIVGEHPKNVANV